MSREYIEENSMPQNLQIIEQIVLPKVKRVFCKICKKELTRGNEVLLSSPMKYQYRCACGVEYISTNRYPELVYVNEPEEEFTE